jgi:hypothetical protein
LRGAHVIAACDHVPMCLPTRSRCLVDEPRARAAAVMGRFESLRRTKQRDALIRLLDLRDVVTASHVVSIAIFSPLG